jgi:hypothetical protein
VQQTDIQVPCNGICHDTSLVCSFVFQHEKAGHCKQRTFVCLVNNSTLCTPTATPSTHGGQAGYPPMTEVVCGRTRLQVLLSSLAGRHPHPHEFADKLEQSHLPVLTCIGLEECLHMWMQTAMQDMMMTPHSMTGCGVQHRRYR